MIYDATYGWMGQVIVPVVDEIELGWRVLISFAGQGQKVGR